MTNLFEKPQFYRNLLKGIGHLLPDNSSAYKARSFICVFPTRFCGVGCPFCFFRSPMRGKDSICDNFSGLGTEKFIKFANDANVGYLQISGGGEPFLEKDFIVSCIRRVKADRIILITSGMWACKREKALEVLGKLKEALDSREAPARLTIRLSVSEGHAFKLKDLPVTNLVQVFEELYRDEPNFTLQLKTFDDDTTLYEQLKQNFPGHVISDVGKNQSDDPKLIKVMPWKYRVTFKSGYSVFLGRSRVFDSYLRPDLNDHEKIRRTIDVYDQDLEQSQKFFPSIVFDADGRRGFDWIVEYNGNVCTWQNRLQDNQVNVYEDDYHTVFNVTMQDVISRSYIEKGSQYRDNIVSEVSPKTVALMKAVSVRDYAGNMLFQDDKIKLYYNIRVLQDYIAEGQLDGERLNLPAELKNAINLSRVDLARLYHEASYSMVDLEISRNTNPKLFRDFLELVRLNHFELREKDIANALTHYNRISGLTVTSLDEIKHETGSQIERRLTDRVIQIKEMNLQETIEPKILKCA